VCTAKFPVPVAQRRANVLNDGGLRMAATTGRLGGTDVCQGHRHAFAGRSPNNCQRQEDIRCPVSPQSLDEFNEVPFLDRFDAAAKAGFTAVEFLFPYDHPAKRLADGCIARPDAGTVQPAAWQLGGRRKGFCRAAGRFADLQASLRTALPYAKRPGVKRVHLMAGIAVAATQSGRASTVRAVVR